MKELKKEKVIEEIVGYEAVDGKIFSTKEECQKYEQSAAYVIACDFENVIQDKPFSESAIWEGYGNGSDEFMLGIVDIKDANVLEIVNRYLKQREVSLINPDFIGEKVLFNIGYVYEEKIHCQSCPQTMDMLVKNFIKHIEKFFGEEYILNESVKGVISYRLKNAIDFYQQDSYTEEDLLRTISEVYEMLK